jgi:ubiquinone biosynthesis protein
MINKLITLFKIGRKLALSDTLDIVSKVFKIPIIIRLFFNLMGLFGKKKINQEYNEEEKLCRSMESMGINFIKLGQFLATRPDIIGEKLSDQLQSLQDKVPPFPKKVALDEIQKGIGNENYQEFINISEPIAAASIAQVHKAQIREDGILKEVAIKVLRPDIKKQFNEEIEALMLLAYIIESLIKKTKRLRLVEVVFLLKEITNHEMDLRFEAAAANEFLENTRNDVGFKIPKIYWKLTTDNVLTLDWVEAISIREVEKIKSLGVNLKNLAGDIIQHFLRHAVRDGYFHADMHQGNLLVDNSGQLIFIDFGIMGRIDKINRRFLAEILYGFIKRDYKKVAEVHIAARLVPQNVNSDELAQALRSIGEPIFGQSVKDISGGKLLKQLFEITEKFNMQTQPQLLLLQKTMVVVEGVARKLDPEANIWEISRPVLEKWLKETKDPINEIGNILKDTSEVFKKLPELPQLMNKANQALTFLASGQIPKNSNAYSSLNEKRIELNSFKNQSIIGLLFLVILSIIVF